MSKRLTTIIAILFTSLFFAQSALGATRPLTKFERLTVTKCAQGRYHFYHPYKGNLVADPTRKWCRWTVLGLRGSHLQLWATNPNLAKLVFVESGYSPNSGDPRGYYGLYQFGVQTWRSYRCTLTNDPVEQTRCGVKYIRSRYGNLESAMAHHYRYNWY